MSAATLAVVALALLLVLACVAWARRQRRREHEQAARAEAVALEAAQDDPWFAPDRVRSEAVALFGAVLDAWNAMDRAALAGLLGGGLLDEWRRRLDHFDAKGWRNDVRVTKGPDVRIVDVQDRDDDSRDRVVVLFTWFARAHVVDRDGRRTKPRGEELPFDAFSAYWTLQRAGDRWVVVAIEHGLDGDHHLDAAFDAGTEHVADEAAAELAAADGTGPAAFAVADLDLGDARQAALDLSLVDERFATHVLEATARQALRAWAEAVDGDERALARMATPEAVDALLRPDGPASRLVVRRPRLQRLEVAHLDRGSLVVEATVRGRRYVEDRDTGAVRSGRRSTDLTFTERLRLVPGDDVPWRIAGAGVTSGA